MKLKISRETAIGLSVLLLLTVILVVVAVRRFTRPGPHPDTTIAQLEERQNEHRSKEIEARRPTFADSAPMTVPDAEHVYDKPVQWDAAAKEHHEEKAVHSPDSGLKAIDAAAPPSLAIHDRPHDDEHTEDKHKQAAREPATLSPEASDDRYAVPGASRADISSAKPMVIQVSGDVSGDPARQPDGRVHDEHRTAFENPAALETRATFATGRTEAPPHPDYSAARRGEVDAVENRRPGAASLPPNEMPPAQGNYAQPNYGQPNYAQPNYPAPNYAGRDPRYGYESTAAAPAADNGAAGYPGPGYGRADGPHREEFQRTVAENPLRSDGMYEVLPNDSFWTISKRVYGSGAYFKALAEANRGKAARPDRLSPGLLISTPPVAQLEKDYPDFCPRANHREAVRNRANGAATLAAYSSGRTYVVQEGDTLSSIARNELGKVSRWADIYQLNREALGKDYDYLTPGMKLVMPPTESQSPDRTARRNDTAPPAARY